MNIVILGAPGSGKGTQAKRLAERWNLRHISTGELLREAVAKKTPLGRQVEATLEKGDLVADEVVLKLTQDAITDPAIGTELDGWILDGFPRNEAQAVGLEDVLSSMRDVVDAVIVLDVGPDVVIERIKKRGEGRADDTPETIRKRLDVYKDETLPILDLYEQRYDVYTVDGSKTIDEVTEDIVELVNT